VQSSSFPALNQIKNFGLTSLTGMIKELHLVIFFSPTSNERAFSGTSPLPISQEGNSSHLREPLKGD